MAKFKKGDKVTYKGLDAVIETVGVSIYDITLYSISFPGKCIVTDVDLTSEIEEEISDEGPTT